MKRLAAVLATALAVALASVGLAVPAQAVTLSVSQYEASIASAINASRTMRGLPPVTVSASVSGVARNWSKSMGSSGVFQHNQSYASQIPRGWSAASENIAYGAVVSGQYSYADIHTNLMNSAGHRANILDTSATHVGVGVSFVVRDGYRFTYVTEVFVDYPGSVLPDPRTGVRYADSTRIGTAIDVGRATFPSSDEVVLAPADASDLLYSMIAVPFAYDREAPLLLSKATALGSQTRAEIVRRNPDTVWLVGGTNVISTSVSRELSALGITVRRLGTSSLSGTSAAVAAKMPDATMAFVISTAGGTKYQAAGAAGAAAAAGRPILIVGRTFVPGVTHEALRDMDVRRITVIGDTSVVSSGVLTDLKVHGVTVQRVSGSDRWTSATAIATKFRSITGTGTVTVASGYRAYLFDPVLAGMFGRPVLLSGKSAVPSTTLRWVASNGVAKYIVVGRTNVVTTTASAKIRAA